MSSCTSCIWHHLPERFKLEHSDALKHLIVLTISTWVVKYNMPQCYYASHVFDIPLCGQFILMYPRASLASNIPYVGNSCYHALISLYVSCVSHYIVDNSNWYPMISWLVLTLYMGSSNRYILMSSHLMCLILLTRKVQGSMTQSSYLSHMSNTSTWVV